jgi:predicted nuclease with TOPRIM domain
MKWWKRNKELKQRITQLEGQVKLMQEHILTQNKEVLSLKRKISELKMLLDIAENTKRY